MRGLEVSWDSDTSAARKAWRVYLSENSDDKGKLVAVLDPTESTYTIWGVRERVYHVRVLAVNKGGMEEGWQKSRGRAAHKVKVSSVTPSTPTNAGTQVVSTAVSTRFVADPPAKTDPPQRYEVIRGSDEFTGQMVGEAEVPRDDIEGEAGRRTISVPMPALPGRGDGNTTTLTVRGITTDGRVAGGTAQSVNVPHFDLPNFTPTTLAYIEGTTASSFPTPGGTFGWELDASNGVVMRQLPTSSGATAAWGTSSTGVLARQPSGAYYVTSATITSATLDLGASKTIVLECYDEAQRLDATGIFASLMSRDAAWPSDPLWQDGLRHDMDSPVAVARLVRSDGKPSRPVPPTRWEYKYGGTTAVTGSSWQEYVPGALVTARYLLTRLHLSEPMGFHQTIAPRITVRAWQSHVTAMTHVTLLTKSGSDFTTGELDSVTTGGKTIGVRVDGGNESIQINIAGTIFTAALS